MLWLLCLVPELHLPRGYFHCLQDLKKKSKQKKIDFSTGDAIFLKSLYFFWVLFIFRSVIKQKQR